MERKRIVSTIEYNLNYKMKKLMKIKRDKNGKTK